MFHMQADVQILLFLIIHALQISGRGAGVEVVSALLVLKRRNREEHVGVGLWTNYHSLLPSKMTGCGQNQSYFTIYIYFWWVFLIFAFTSSFRERLFLRKAAMDIKELNNHWGLIGDDWKGLHGNWIDKAQQLLSVFIGDDWKGLHGNWYGHGTSIEVSLS